MAPRRPPHVLPSALAMLATLAVCGAAGCTCGGDSTVPFQGGERPTLRPADPDAQLAPLEASAYPDGTRLVELEGVAVRIEAGSIRASAVFDFDRDGDRDALLVVLDAPNAAARVFYAERRGDEIAPLVSLGSRATFDLTEAGRTTRCGAESAAITPLSSALVLATIESRCEDEGAPRLASTWVLSADERPRALELFELAGRASGEGLGFAAHDRDQDGHDDLEVEVRVATATQPVTTTLVWMNRAAGLAREGEQPEPTLATLATQARDHVRRSPNEAIVAAERAIALRDAVCREAERARLFIGGTRGVPCGTSASIGRAYASRAAALARRLGAGVPSDAAGFEAALEAFVALDHQGVSIREGDRALVRESWLRVASVPPDHFLVHHGGAASPVSARRAPRLSTLGFLDEERIVVRGGQGHVFRIEADTLVAEPAGARPLELFDARVRDADGTHELVAIERSCEGTVIVLAPAGGIVDAVTGGRRELLVAPRPAPAIATCPNLPEGHRADDDGFVALGWAPSGIVLARGAALTFVPLDAAAAPAGQPTLLAPQTPAPAPLAAGAAVPDAHAFALAMPFGIVVIDRDAHTARLFHDEDFAVPQGLPIDVALSPSAARAAWICGGEVCWAELRAVDVTRPPVLPGMPPRDGLDPAQAEAPSPPPASEGAAAPP